MDLRWSPLVAVKLRLCPLCGPDVEPRGGHRWRWLDGAPDAGEKVCAAHLDLSDWAAELGLLRWPDVERRRQYREANGSANVVTWAWTYSDYEGASGIPTHDEAARIEEVASLVYPITEEEEDHDEGFEESVDYEHAA